MGARGALREPRPTSAAYPANFVAKVASREELADLLLTALTYPMDEGH